VICCKECSSHFQLLLQLEKIIDSRFMQACMKYIGVVICLFLVLGLFMVLDSYLKNKEETGG